MVDDNATNRFIITRQLETWKMKSKAASSPLEALDWLKQGETFDAAILDMQMPDMDGLTLAHRIRALGGAGGKIPMILFTSLGHREVGDQDDVFSAHLVKPLKPSALFDVLVNVFNGAPMRVVSHPKSQLEPGKRFDANMASANPRRILLAEDNSTNQKLIIALLGRLGYHADVSANGLEALEALQRQQYDVVLMDVQMPEMGGLEATRYLRRLLSPATSRM